MQFKVNEFLKPVFLASENHLRFEGQPIDFFYGAEISIVCAIFSLFDAD